MIQYTGFGFVSELAFIGYSSGLQPSKKVVHEFAVLVHSQAYVVCFVYGSDLSFRVASGRV